MQYIPREALGACGVRLAMTRTKLSPLEVSVIVTAVRQRAARMHYMADEFLQNGNHSAFRSYRKEGNDYNALVAKLETIACGSALEVCAEGEGIPLREACEKGAA